MKNIKCEVPDIFQFKVILARMFYLFVSRLSTFVWQGIKTSMWNFYVIISSCSLHSGRVLFKICGYQYLIKYRTNRFYIVNFIS